MMQRHRHYNSILVGIVFCSIIAGQHAIVLAQTFSSLPMEVSAWNKKVFPEQSTITQDQAASYGFFSDAEHGQAISIGPWRAGRWNCRLENKTFFDSLTGTIRGVYKTANTPPMAAFVRVSYYVKGAKQRDKTYYLPTAKNWEPFEIVTRHPMPSADQIRLSFGLQVKTEGSVLFSKLAFSSHTPAESFPNDPGAVTRHRGKTGHPTGAFYRLRHDNGTWWFVDPNGSDWYSIGTVVRNWPSEKREIEGRETARLMREMGFNSVAGWSNIYRWRELNTVLEAEGKPTFGVFYAMESDKLPDPFDRLIKADGSTTAPIGSGHAFPDPFDPAWQTAYRQRAQTIARLVAGRSWFVAWFADNELTMNDLHRYVYSQHAAQAFKAFLQRQYANIQSLNAAWGTTFSSFSHLLNSRPDPEMHHGPMFQDFKRFEREMIKQYINVTTRILREADPDHLIFTPRFHRNAWEVWLEYLDLFTTFDAVALNYYPRNATWSPGLGKSSRQLFDAIYAKTGKPLLISEWSVPALDSGFYNDAQSLDHSWPVIVGTQEQRARQAARAALDYANIPYVIGSHWFTWNDIDSSDRQANRGLFKTDGEPWEELVSRLSDVHKRIHSTFYPYHKQRLNPPKNLHVVR